MFSNKIVFFCRCLSSLLTTLFCYRIIYRSCWTLYCWITNCGRDWIKYRRLQWRSLYCKQKLFRFQHWNNIIKSIHIILIGLVQKYSWISLCQNFLKSCFKLSALQLILILLSQILMWQNFGFLEVTFYPVPHRQIHSIFSLCQNYKSNQLIKSVKVSITWPPVFTASGEIYFHNCFN